MLLWFTTVSCIEFAQGLPQNCCSLAQKHTTEPVFHSDAVKSQQGSSMELTEAYRTEGQEHGHPLQSMDQLPCEPTLVLTDPQWGRKWSSTLNQILTSQ